MTEPHPIDELGLDPGTRIGPYLVEAFLAKGGMGCLVRARDEKLGRPVAVKLILPRFATEPEFRARFERECRMLARINHPNVVTVYYSDVWNGAPFYAMELVEGATLDAATAGDAAPDWRRLADWLAQCCHGLEAAREQGVIHRDLKPANILLDRGGRIRIVDFGLAKQAEVRSDLTASSMFVGTPHYVSPEQARGARLDWRSDAYSLGATFFHLLAQRTVFDADSAMEVVAAHIRATPTPLATAAPGVPRDLCRLIDRLLDKEPAARAPGPGYAGLIGELETLLRHAAPAPSPDPEAFRTRVGRPAAAPGPVPTDRLAVPSAARSGPSPAAATLASSAPRDLARAETVAGAGPGTADDAELVRKAFTQGGAAGPLLRLRGLDSETEYVLVPPGLATGVGRDVSTPRNGILLIDSNASPRIGRFHARVVPEDGGWVLDLAALHRDRGEPDPGGSRRRVRVGGTGYETPARLRLEAGMVLDFEGRCKVRVEDCAGPGGEPSLLLRTIEVPPDQAAHRDYRRTVLCAGPVRFGRGADRGFACGPDAVEPLGTIRPVEGRLVLRSDAGEALVLAPGEHRVAGLELEAGNLGAT